MSSLFRLCLLLGFSSAGLLAQQASSPFPARLADRVLLHDTALCGEVLLAVGDRGTVLRIEKGEWKHVETPVQRMLTSVSAHGDLALAVGHDGMILRSEDAGKSWELVHHKLDVRKVGSYTLGEDEKPFRAPWVLLDVHLYSDRDAIAVGSFGLVMRSRDGGRSWQESSIEWEGFDPEFDINEMDLYRLRVAEDGSSWMTNNEGDVFRSNDRGANWELLFAEVEEEEAAGEDAGGGFDQALDLTSSQPPLFDIHPYDSNTAVAVGIQGTIIRTTDGGTTWKRVRSGLRSILHGLIADKGKLWAVGYGGKVLESSDRGATWKDVSIADRIHISGGIHQGAHRWLLTERGLRPFDEVGR